MCRHRRLQLAEIRPLALPTGNQQDIAVCAHTLQSSYGGADIGTLGIIDVAHPAKHRDQLAAVWQALELAQAGGHALHRQVRGMSQGQCREGIGDIVAPHQAQFIRGQQWLEAVAQVFPAFDHCQAEPTEIRLAHAPTD